MENTGQHIPKADTSKLFKNTVKFESYLTDIKNRKHRITFTKYRLSCFMNMTEPMGNDIYDNISFQTL